MEKSIRGISEMTLLEHQQYHGAVYQAEPHAEINKHEFRLYSQNGEDGILLWLFSRIGTTSKKFVEFGMGTGRECISSNLVLNMGWKGYFMDGSDENVADANLFFKLMMPWEEFAKLQIEKKFISKENIKEILKY